MRVLDSAGGLPTLLELISVSLASDLEELLHLLRDVAPAKFLDLWDDGLGEPVVPCPGHHIDVALYGAGITIDGFRLADAVEVRASMEGRTQYAPPDQRVYMLGANLCPACGRAYGDHEPPVGLDLVCHGTYANAETEREAIWAMIQSGAIAHDPPPPGLADTMR